MARRGAEARGRAASGRELERRRPSSGGIGSSSSSEPSATGPYTGHAQTPYACRLTPLFCRAAPPCRRSPPPPPSLARLTASSIRTFFAPSPACINSPSLLAKRPHRPAASMVSFRTSTRMGPPREEEAANEGSMRRSAGVRSQSREAQPCLLAVVAQPRQGGDLSCAQSVHGHGEAAPPARGDSCA